MKKFSWKIIPAKCLAHSLAISLCSLAAAYGFVLFQEYQSGIPWSEPKAVDPGSSDIPPSDAVILFDGNDLSQWVDSQWIVKDGYAIANGADMKTEQSFGDCQLHLEWAAPEVTDPNDAWRGNSGVFLMGAYEVQILDSYRNEVPFDCQAGAIYKQRPPLVNACRKPGEWQTYDIIFIAPRFDASGDLEKPGYITVLHNGVLILNHFELQGQSAHVAAPVYKPHADKLPLTLQYHHHPVKFRNIWIREFDAYAKTPAMHQ